MNKFKGLEIINYVNCSFLNIVNVQDVDYKIHGVT